MKIYLYKCSTLCIVPSSSSFVAIRSEINVWIAGMCLWKGTRTLTVIRKNASYTLGNIELKDAITPVGGCWQKVNRLTDKLHRHSTSNTDVLVRSDRTNKPATFCSWWSNTHTLVTLDFVWTDLHPPSEPPSHLLTQSGRTVSHHSSSWQMTIKIKIKAASCVFCVLRCGGCSCAVLITRSSKWKKKLRRFLVPLWQNQLPLRLDKFSLSLSQRCFLVDFCRNRNGFRQRKARLSRLQ